MVLPFLLRHSPGTAREAAMPRPMAAGLLIELPMVAISNCCGVVV